jgi:hypothetical protein
VGGILPFLTGVTIADNHRFRVNALIVHVDNRGRTLALVTWWSHYNGGCVIRVTVILQVDSFHTQVDQLSYLRQEHSKQDESGSEEKSKSDASITKFLFAMFLPKVRQLVNLGVEGIYLEDDRDTDYAASVIMAPPSYKSKGPSSVIYVNNQGIYSEPVVVGNGDPSKEREDATHLKHPLSTYSAPPTAYLKTTESAYGSTRVLRVTDDLRGRHPQKRPQSEVAFGSNGRPRSLKGTLTRSRSQTSLGAL